MNIQRAGRLHDRPDPLFFETDTYSFTESGAYAAACFSDKSLFVHRTGTGDTLGDIIGMFPEADLIIIEGCKGSRP